MYLCTEQGYFVCGITTTTTNFTKNLHLAKNFKYETIHTMIRIQEMFEMKFNQTLELITNIQ